ncbi:hypothetical protein, variant 1 [Aphanomyces invadans]|uniref:HECT-type E3 ubiquitin transferase n=2 Tax=Aphanomyces invadans TaxID=157072 RepID=A0A024UM00_9STRA|nr:hypothetical protein, variant 1 [Aphanomyces invadans]ETW07324.1 hypothetical protein, variant 1 [Aphanomyces invadans]|eukprot:XP_008863418.1 hypothetical protein, variant 1 [Aphanomyces invadans]
MGTASTDVAIIGAAMMLLLIIMGYCFVRIVISQKGQHVDPNFFRRVPLMEEDFLGALYGLNRNDIEELMCDVEKWNCGVCAFANIPDATSCALCETKPGIVVTENGVGPELLHPTNLTPMQLSARTRKQWLRTLDASGQIVWSQMTNATTDDKYFVVTATLPTVSEIDIYAVADTNVGDQVQIVVDEPSSEPPTTDATHRTSHSQKIDDAVDEALASRMSLERDSIELVDMTRPEQQVRVELAFQPLSMDSAGRTLVGTTLPPWLVRQVDALTNEHFSVKYLALLSLLRANMDYGYSKLKVYRERIYEESMQLLQLLGPLHRCARTRIELLGEAGVDAGGLQREWYTLFTQAVFEPSAGLFVATDSYGYTLNPASNSAGDLAKFRAVGRLLARSILDEQVLPFHFTVPLFKMILGTPLSMTDMLYTDKQIYTSLKFVESSADVESLCLDFSVALASGEVVELMPNGQDIMVTARNQTEYVQRMLQYLLFDRIQPQLQSLLTGLFEILPQHYLIMFDHKELELVLCGVTEIDVADWKQFTATSMTLRRGGEHSIKMEWFWEIVTAMSTQDRAKLLQFATGSTRVPVQGFKGLTSYDGLLCPFSVKAIDYRRGILPRAHACFNRIDLPLYPTKVMMEEGLKTVVQLAMSDFTMV